MNMINLIISLNDIWIFYNGQSLLIFINKNKIFLINKQRITDFDSNREKL